MYMHAIHFAQLIYGYFGNTELSNFKYHEERPTPSPSGLYKRLNQQDCICCFLIYSDDKIENLMNDVFLVIIMLHYRNNINTEK